MVASGLLAVFCFNATSFLASCNAALASDSTLEVRPMASLRASTVTLARSSEKILATSEYAFTFTSATLMALMTSAMAAVSFRSAVSFLKSATFLPEDSTRALNWLSFSVVVVAKSFEKLFASPNFSLKKDLAWLMAVSTFTTAASLSANALKDSSAGKTSMPFRKGISASWQSAAASSAATTFSAPSVSIFLAASPDRCPCVPAVTDSAFFRKSAARSLSCINSSFMAP
mmetsp:Transcript_82740/g.149254  ORF Transcript_82740/g.149254 Transcript_82740/m.149254 type:complete len:230 (+) Transcript_82740:344-1033(+)